MIKEGIAKFLKLDSLMENLTGYVESRMELLKFELKEDAAKVISKLSVMIAMLITGLFFLLFISLAVAIEIGRSVGYLAGFAMVGGVYLIGAIILYVRKDILMMRIETYIKGVLQKKKN